MDNTQQSSTNGTSARRAPVTEADVQRMMRIKDFYELLQVSKTATDEEIKKQYKKLALRYHPDKLRLPGAQDVFKKIAQAYDCLTDPDKRAYYDRTGSDEPQQQQRYEQPYYGAQEFDPNDIFNMFFGNGFFPNQQHRQHHQQRRHQNNQDNRHANQPQNNFKGLLQLLPFLLIMFSGIFGQLFQESPEFSLSKSQSFPVHRKSLFFGVDYFVGSSFEDSVMDNVDYLPSFEWKVENEFIGNLKGNCVNQQNKRRQYLNQAKMSWTKRDQTYYQRLSEQVDMSACNELDRLSNEYDISRYF